MTTALLVAGIVLQLALHILRHRPKPKPVTTVSAAHVQDALREAFRAAGLNVDHLQPGFDLAQTGKLHEVIAHAARHLGVTAPTTVAEVAAFLERHACK